jgi:ketosteroid isomerase-like protein
MKQLSYFKQTLLASVILLFFVSFQAKAQKNDKDLIINSMNKATADWNKGDLDAYMSLYDPAATMMMPTGRVGLTAIRAMYEKYYFEGKTPKQELAYDTYELTMLGRDHALLTGRFILKANTNLKERSGTYSLVFVRKKDGWKLLHDHSG